MPKSYNHPSKGEYDYPVSAKGTSENGRGARKSNAVKKNLANKPGKLQQKETGKHKRNFRP